MKNELEKIDNLFKKSLENYTQKPSSDMFDNMMLKIDKKHKHFSFFNVKYLLFAFVPFVIFLIWKIDPKQSPEDSQNSQTPFVVSENNQNNSKEFAVPKPIENKNSETNVKNLLSDNDKPNMKPLPEKDNIIKQEWNNVSDKNVEKNDFSKNRKSENLIEKSPSHSFLQNDHQKDIVENIDSEKEKTHNRNVQNNDSENFITTKNNENQAQNSILEELNVAERMLNSNVNKNDSSEVKININPIESSLLSISKIDSADSHDKPNIISPITKKPDWSIELIMVKNYQITNLTSKKSEMDDFVVTRKNALNPSFSNFNYGLLWGINKGPYYFQGGVSYTQINEFADYGQVLGNKRMENQIIPNGNPYNFMNNNSFYYIDTTSYWHYYYVSNPTIQVADSVLTYNTDTLLVNPFDTLLIVAFDTLSLNQLRVRYSLVEFPIWVGYDFTKSRSRFGYSLQIGLIPAILVASQGSYFNGDNEAFISKETFPTRKFVIFGSLKAAILYNFNRRTAISAGVEAKTSLNSITNPDKGWTQFWSSYGLNVGIKYYFNR